MPTLTDSYLTILRQLSETEPRTIFQIGAGLTETWSAVEIAVALDRLRGLGLAAPIIERGELKHIRTSAGTDALAGTKSGVAVE
jgi:hypothetical protein